MTLHGVKPCEIKTIGETDRLLSEMKYFLDHPEEYDAATMQTVKHHLEDMELFMAYATKRMTVLRAKSLPPTTEQRASGY